MWREYIGAHLNEENPNLEVERALRTMKAKKAHGPSGIFSDHLKFTGRTGITQITKVFPAKCLLGGLPGKVEGQYYAAFLQGERRPTIM